MRSDWFFWIISQKLSFWLNQVADITPSLPPPPHLTCSYFGLHHAKIDTPWLNYIQFGAMLWCTTVYMPALPSHGLVLPYHSAIIDSSAISSRNWLVIPSRLQSAVFVFAPHYCHVWKSVPFHPLVLLFSLILSPCLSTSPSVRQRGLDFCVMCCTTISWVIAYSLGALDRFCKSSVEQGYQVTYVAILHVHVMQTRIVRVDSILSTISIISLEPLAGRAVGQLFIN